MSEPKPSFVSHLDAARRQLKTAIVLWFADDDAVSVHTLATSAYQIIHDINRRAKGPPLIFDNPIISKELQKQAVASMKMHMNFFKHADFRKGETALTEIEFDPSLSELFMHAALLGLEYLKNALTDTESAFLFWCMLHRSDWFHQNSVDAFLKPMDVNTVNGLRRLNKGELFKCYIDSRTARRTAST